MLRYRLENAELNKSLQQLKEEAAIEVQVANDDAKQHSEQYVALFRKQVRETERSMGLLKDQHNGLQQALALRVKEVEELYEKQKQQYRQLEGRRKLELEGYSEELKLLTKCLARLELKVYGRRVPLPPEPAESARKGALVAKSLSDINSIKGRVAALEGVLDMQDLS